MSYLDIQLRTPSRDLFAERLEIASTLFGFDQLREVSSVAAVNTRFELYAGITSSVLESVGDGADR